MRELLSSPPSLTWARGALNARGIGSRLSLSISISLSLSPTLSLPHAHAFTLIHTHTHTHTPSLSHSPPFTCSRFLGRRVQKYSPLAHKRLISRSLTICLSLPTSLLLISHVLPLSLTRSLYLCPSPSLPLSHGRSTRAIRRQSRVPSSPPMIACSSPWVGGICVCCSGGTCLLPPHPHPFRPTPRSTCAVIKKTSKYTKPIPRPLTHNPNPTGPGPSLCP